MPWTRSDDHCRAQPLIGTPEGPRAPPEKKKLRGESGGAKFVDTNSWFYWFYVVLSWDFSHDEMAGRARAMSASASRPHAEEVEMAEASRRQDSGAARWGTQGKFEFFFSASAETGSSGTTPRFRKTIGAERKPRASFCLVARCFYHGLGVGTFQPGHAVQVLSKSSGDAWLRSSMAWVDAVVHQVLADQAVWVRYGNAQKVIPLELQSSTLRRKASSVSTWALGERVQVFSKSQQLWISGVVREVWPNGSVHVQYEEAQHLYKVIAPELQQTLLRPFTTAVAASAEAPEASRSAADQRLVDLAHESECLKATIARQQEQINALLKQKAPELKAGKAPEEVELEAARENWTCRDCTFQNIQELQECEMCGAARCQSQPSKKRRVAPAVIDVPLEASPVAVRDLPDGPREFLRQATQVPFDGESAPSRPLKLRRNFVESLCPYQRHGVAWLWQLYLRKQGGILADEMGLGKTVQACALIEAMNSSGASRSHVLVVMPELARWCPGCPVYIYHGSPGHRLRALKAVVRRGGVLLTSYAIIKNEEDKLAFVNASEMLSPGNWLGKPKQDAAPRGADAEKPWDLVICDEAHVMRTISTLLGKAMRKIQAR
eukprot:s922_g22.t1